MAPRSSPSERAVARWMASRVRSSVGWIAEAERTTRSPSSTSAIRERTVRARRTVPPPRRLATRSTSIRAITLDTRSGQDLRSSRRALVSGSDTTSFTMAEESRYRSGPATDYVRSSRSFRRASVPFVVTGPFGGAISRRSPSGGLARPEATSLRRAEADSSTGPSTATGLPRSVTSRRSPPTTRRRYRERFWRSSRTPTRFGSMCTHSVASLAKLLPHNPEVTGSNPVPATKKPRSRAVTTWASTVFGPSSSGASPGSSPTSPTPRLPVTGRARPAARTPGRREPASRAARAGRCRW